MKRALGALLAVLGTTLPARAYIDSTPTLGKLIADSNQIVVLKVEKVSRDKPSPEHAWWPRPALRPGPTHRVDVTGARNPRAVGSRRGHHGDGGTVLAQRSRYS
jgi:hypothetical protein